MSRRKALILIVSAVLVGTIGSFTFSAYAVSCLPLPSDAAHWWQGEGNAQDSLGGNHGTLVGGAAFAPGMVGESFSFDGVDDLVEASAEGFPTGSSDRTLELWVKIDAQVAEEAFFAGYGAFGADAATYHLGTSNGVLFFSSWGTALLGPSLELGKWYHVAVTNTGTVVTLYLDGTVVNSGAITINTPLGAQFYIGKVAGVYGDIRRLQGQVDEVALYSRALEPEEIAAVYQAGSAGKCAPAPSLRPVIIIPGILGSELYNGSDLVWADTQQMDFDINDEFLTESLSLDAQGNPLQAIQVGNAIQEQEWRAGLKTIIFRNLVNDLESSGYILNDTYFFFPYDWRLDLEVTKSLLQQKIEDIQNQTGAQGIDIVAHSMGGLLTKDYINEFGTSNVSKLIFIGTPHLGAPKAGKVLLEGDRFGIPTLEEDRMQELSVNSISAYELLPQPEYFNQFTGYIEPYAFLTPLTLLDFADTKDFLLDQGMNSSVFSKAEDFFAKNLHAIDLSAIDAYNVAGCRRGSTQAAYRYGFANLFIGGVA